MKKLNVSIAITGLFIASFFISSCGNKQSEVQQDQTEESIHQHEAKIDSSKMDSMNHKATAVVYACPMHPEVTGKAGDKCSKCGMALEATKAAEDKK